MTQIPDRDTEWGDREFDGLSVAVNEDRIRDVCGLDYGLGEHEAGYVIDGLDGYLSEVHAEEIDVPPYYSRFEDFPTHVLVFTVGNNRNGWGITYRQLERWVRVATGGGRYRSDDLTLIATESPTENGSGRYFLRYGDDAWVFPPQSIRSIPDGYDHDWFPIAEGVEGTIEVPDEDPRVRDGLAKFVRLASEWFDVEVTAYDQYSGSGYYFDTADGAGTYINGRNAERLVAVPSDPEDVRHSYTIETEYDEEYEVSWDEIEYDIGEEIRRRSRVVGYQLRWEDPRTSNRVSMHGKITARATYYYLLYRPDSFNDGRSRFEVRDTQETLAKFDPENEEWSPM